MRQVPKWQKLWNRLQKKDKDLHVENKLKADLERTFLHKLCIKFINILERIPLEGIHFYLYQFNINTTQYIYIYIY